MITPSTRALRKVLPILTLLATPWIARAEAPSPASASVASVSTELSWNDTAYDVYLDGELLEGVVVLSTREPSRLAVLADALEAAVVADTEAGEVYLEPRSGFELTAGGAVSPEAAGALAGRHTLVRDRHSRHHLLTFGGRTLLLSPHQGPEGTINLEDLWHLAPTWRRRADAYEPDATAVEALAAHEGEVEVVLALGTWCGDSRHHVPELVKALEAAANPRLRLEVVGIRRGFEQPAGFVREQRVINVPTVIVRDGSREIGRIVETPAAETMEADLAAILRGEPSPHRGRLAREEVIASGRYRRLDADGRELARESWELYRTEEGGRLLHCRIEEAGRSTEVWRRRDADGASNLAEITRREGEALSRTRLWIDADGELQVHTRGNRTGIVDQWLTLPAGAGLSIPCIAELGYEWLRRGRPDEPLALSALELGGAGTPPAGELIELRLEAGESGEVATPAGERPARRLGHGKEGHPREGGRWWLDDELGVVLGGEVPGRGRVVLEELSLAGEG